MAQQEARCDSSKSLKRETALPERVEAVEASLAGEAEVRRPG